MSCTAQKGHSPPQNTRPQWHGTAGTGDGKSGSDSCSATDTRPAPACICAAQEKQIMLDGQVNHSINSVNGKEKFNPIPFSQVPIFKMIGDFLHLCFFWFVSLTHCSQFSPLTWHSSAITACALQTPVSWPLLTATIASRSTQPHTLQQCQMFIVIFEGFGSSCLVRNEV